MLGGGPRDQAGSGGGYFVEPTIFTGVDNKMRIAQEEVFGPVLVGHPLRGRGRGGRASPTTSPTAWPPGSGRRSIRRALPMSERLQAGTIWVNTYRAVSFMSPFGGYKASASGARAGWRRSRTTCSQRASGSTTGPAAAIRSS